MAREDVPKSFGFSELAFKALAGHGEDSDVVDHRNLCNRFIKAVFGEDLMDERAPWLMKPKTATAAKPNIKWRGCKLGELISKMALRAWESRPAVAVTEARLDNLDDAWRTMPCDAGERQACDCLRCVAIDILQITHVISEREFLEAITKVATYVSRLEGTWAIGSLAPGKSNFWLSGMLLRNAELVKPPTAVILTSVNDSKPWLVQPINIFTEKKHIPDHIIVLDDMSYSGTQLCNLLGNLAAAFPAPKTLIHACPLFLTPHAKVAVRQKVRTLKAVLAECHQVTPTNDSMFAELGAHRHSRAGSFAELVRLYAGGKAWGDTRALEANKTLTTCTPYYKIPDYFSCPEAAYLSKIISYRESHKNVPEQTVMAIERYRFKEADQRPNYKNIKM